MKNSFRDPVTGILKAWGYTDANQPGDIKQKELDSFNLDPRKWKWDGNKWVEHENT